MKKTLSLFVLSLSIWITGADALAMARGGSSQPAHPDPHGPGLIRCSYDDMGWEEHGGHASCTECLARHGSCEENCYSVSYTCVVKGQDRAGKDFTVEAESDHSELDASNRALDRCYYSGGADCRVDRCGTQERLRSSRRCG